MQIFDRTLLVQISVSKQQVDTLMLEQTWFASCVVVNLREATLLQGCELTKVIDIIIAHCMIVTFYSGMPFIVVLISEISRFPEAG